MALEGTAYSTYSTFLAGAIFTYFALIIIIRRWFSPISDIPGPFLGSFSVLWQILNTIKGHTEEETIAEHKKHGTQRSIDDQLTKALDTDWLCLGDFVRIGYNEVSVGHPDAVNDVLRSQMDKVLSTHLIKSRANPIFRVTGIESSRFQTLVMSIKCLR